MDLRTDIRDGFAVIALSGRLTATGAPLLRKAVNDLVAGGDSRIVIDMTDLQFVDSSGLGALVGGLKSARVAGGDLRIAAVPEAVRTVLHLTNLDPSCSTTPRPRRRSMGADRRTAHVAGLAGPAFVEHVLDALDALWEASPHVAPEDRTLFALAVSEVSTNIAAHGEAEGEPDAGITVEVDIAVADDELVATFVDTADPARIDWDAAVSYTHLTLPTKA